MQYTFYNILIFYLINIDFFYFFKNYWPNIFFMLKKINLWSSVIAKVSDAICNTECNWPRPRSDEMPKIQNL
jgi:hypothetical protein